jgi:hypothetical protein
MMMNSHQRLSASQDPFEDTACAPRAEDRRRRRRREARGCSLQRLLAIVSLTLGLGLGLGGSAQAALHFTEASVSLDDPPLIDADGNPLLNPDDTFVPSPFNRQAGAHPDLTLRFQLPLDGNNKPLEAVRDIDLDFPQGLVGNPTAVPECPAEKISNADNFSDCPADTQIGYAELDLRVVNGGGSGQKVAVFNLTHGDDEPARFGFNYSGVVGLIRGRVRPNDYGISGGSFSISQSVGIQGVRVTLWGVPADASHDSLRQSHTIGINGPFDGPGGNYITNGSAGLLKIDTPPVPFLTSPTVCSDVPVAFKLRGDSWENPGAWDERTLTSDPSGVPFAFEGCERVPFKPSVAADTLARSADSPTGLKVDVKVPQLQDPNGIATAHVRRVRMTFPDGMSVNPSSAAGLGACSPAQIGLGSNAAPTCPASSKLGTVRVDTPVLAEPLSGDIILATQNDNPFRSLIALYIVVKGPGFYLKLPGKVDLDPSTGRLTATFDNTPQLPFSELSVDFTGGSQAALATPTRCGNYSTRTEITSWASDVPVVRDSPMTIDQNCAAKAFTPSFAAGTTNPAAGQYSPFSFTLTRSDGMPMLSQINTVLPKGMLANIASVPQCDPVPANAGFCPAASRIGSTSVLSGPGAQPLGLTGNVYLTGPYKDAPFGLSIAVNTAGQAGPFDLGVVVVRAGLYVDRNDAHVTVKSDPLPTIIQGVPLRLRQVNVTIDRDKFLFNPTSCEKQSIFGSFQALGGGSSDQAVPFQAVGCGDLNLKPTLKFALKGKKSTKDGTYPGVEATLTDPGGGSNYKQVEAKLPLALVLEPENAQALCKPEQAKAYNCPKTSIIGTATAKSVLPHDLTGPVYFVEGRRIDPKTKREKATLPNLWIPLSADGVTIDIRAKSQVDSIDRLVTTFTDLPDAPIKSFKLKINGGKHGVLVVSGKSTCDRDMGVDMRYTGQNGETKVSNLKASVEGCKAKVKSTKASSRAITLKVGNLAAGKLTVTGAGLLQRADKTLKDGPEATVIAKLTSKARATLRRQGKVTVKVSVAYKPKKGATVKLSQSVTVRR